MTAVWTLVPAPARGQRRWQTGVIIVLMVLAPVLVVLTLLPSGDRRPPVALVNLDQPVTTGPTPVAVGTLLTESLMTADNGIAWDLTDPDTARTGLETGGYVAVVTVPADFSATTMTLSGPAPEQATLTVQTSTRHGYLSGVVAQALSSSLPAVVSAQLTEQFVEGTLTAFARLSEGIGQAADGADQIATGTAQAGSGTDALSGGGQQLADGLDDIDEAMGGLPAAARELGRLTATGAAASGRLAAQLAEQADGAAALEAEQRAQVARVDALLARIAADPTADAATLEAEVRAVRDGAARVDDALAGSAAALTAEARTAAEVAVGAEAISLISRPVAAGLDELVVALGTATAGARQMAGGITQLVGALDSLAAGGDDLAAGLSESQQAIPAYDQAQQEQIAAVVAQPIRVDAPSDGGPTSGLASALAALVPVALWLGAVVIFLVLAPFARSSLASAAPAWRLARSSALVLVAVAAGQAALVWGIVLLTGVAPDRAAVAAGLTLATALAFTSVHQSLVAFLPRAGLIISLVLLGLQAVAAGTFAPQAVAPTASGPLAALPLSLAVQGANALVGGSLHAMLGAATGLACWGVLGAIGTVVAIRRVRARALGAAVLARV